MANDLRAKICLAVASLEADEEDVESKLKPLLDQAASELLLLVTPDEQVSGISPLLVASDKGNVASLLFLARYDTALVGSPLDASQEENGGNMPIHHAAMAGCSEAWEIFADLLVNNQKDHSSKEESIFLVLAGVTNSHGDTPLQIAVPAGHLEFLQKWHQLATTTAASSTTETGGNKKQIQTILQKTNQAGDTCSSLACCHGHVHILDFLLNNCHLSISHDEITKCQQAVHRMDQALTSVTDPIALECFHHRQARVHNCLNMLQAAVAKQAEDAANELLLVADNVNKATTRTTASNDARNHKITCSSKKSKKKKKGKGNNQKANSSNNNNAHQAAAASSGAVSGEERFHVMRLNDGRVAVSVQGENDVIGNVNESPPHFPLLATTTSTLLPSAETMLRQRFRRRDDDDSHHEHDIDAVMDALCLDVSMLLYTPHGMALNLSPSQLDAVQQILEEQIRSVQQARNLQHRMHQPPPTTTTTKSVEILNQETSRATAK